MSSSSGSGSESYSESESEDDKQEVVIPIKELEETSSSRRKKKKRSSRHPPRKPAPAPTPAPAPAPPPPRFKETQVSYHPVHIEGVVRDLCKGAEAEEGAVLREVIELKVNLDSTFKCYLRPLGSVTPVALGLFVHDLGERTALHFAHNGNRFHHVVPFSGNGVEVSDTLRPLGSLQELRIEEKKQGAKELMRKRAGELTRQRPVYIENLWEFREEDLLQYQNDNPVTELASEGTTVFSAMHPVVYILSDDEYEAVGKSSLSMNTKKFKDAVKDLFHIVRVLASQHSNSLTITLQPVFTDKKYAHDSGAQWRNVLGITAYYTSRGVKREDVFEAYMNETISVDFELVLCKTIVSD